MGLQMSLVGCERHMPNTQEKVEYTLQKTCIPSVPEGERDSQIQHMEPCSYKSHNSIYHIWKPPFVLEQREYSQFSQTKAFSRFTVTHIKISTKSIDKYIKMRLQQSDGSDM